MQFYEVSIACASQALLSTFPFLPELNRDATAELFLKFLNSDQEDAIKKIELLSETNLTFAAVQAYLIELYCLDAQKPYYAKRLWRVCRRLWSITDLENSVLKDWEGIVDKRGMTFLAEATDCISNTLIRDLFYHPSSSSDIRFLIIKAYLSSAIARNEVHLARCLWTSLLNDSQLTIRDRTILEETAELSGVFPDA